MAKYKVHINYCLWHYESYEVEVEPDKLEEFLDCPDEFIAGDPIETDTGDVMDGTWEVETEEIGVLDQIVEAIDDES